MAGHQGQGPVSIVSGAIHGDSILIGINGRIETEQQRGFPALPDCGFQVSTCLKLPTLHQDALSPLAVSHFKTFLP